jgi:hypothetical protein
MEVFMLKTLLISQLVILVLALFGYWNYRQICRSAEDLMRLFSDRAD